ncbi:sialic acid TRAP transporter substrate-binding protein SiaP [Thalassospira alkalitolerans]|uniref:ABC transporter substrate-binding protein n=1 Tax=Thalassospira alkalitolerans TaxID=1293890 RepID=A0A1Y2LE02_9PROT|nr:sialic acid TRAP transporter substrate-binding protein SiaP [Thalassospira alkalitolerans]OSQ48330.1 ABC transporter substrate-binding protein [Thalassospira alkalitolerans]|tara:strand:- start:17141 stop:18133 length:993 start_codon:yes stop_codon:yes gene_type:complete
MTPFKTLSKCLKFGAVTLAAATGFASISSAQEILKFGHVYESATPYHQAALRAADAFKAATNGAYEIQVFPASQLGNESALNEALVLGTVDIIYTGPAFMALSYPPISISDYPFTMRGYDHWKAYVNSDLFGELAQNYTDVTGNTVAAMTYYGARHVTANKPILTPADMKGLKIRTPNAPAYQMFPKITGANPTPMAFSEVYLALQQKVVDAQENPLPTIQFKKFYEVQSNINLTGHILNSLGLLISQQTMNKLGDDAPKLQQALKDAAAWCSEEIYTSEGNLVEWFRDQGVTVNDVDRGPFIDAVAPALTGSDMPWEPSVYERLKAIKG